MTAMTAELMANIAEELTNAFARIHALCRVAHEAGLEQEQPVSEPTGQQTLFDSDSEYQQVASENNAPYVPATLAHDQGMHISEEERKLLSKYSPVAEWVEGFLEKRKSPVFYSILKDHFAKHFDFSVATFSKILKAMVKANRIQENKAGRSILYHLV